MPIKEAEFNKFINKAQDEFEAFAQKVDDGLESIYKILNAGVETITTYLTNDFTTALRNHVTDGIKVHFAANGALKETHKASSMADELLHAINPLIYELRTKLHKKYSEIEVTLSRQPETLGITKYFSHQIFQTLEMIFPSREAKNLDPKNDLRKRENWDPIIKKLKAAKQITD